MKRLACITIAMGLLAWAPAKAAIDTQENANPPGPSQPPAISSGGTQVEIPPAVLDCLNLSFGTAVAWGIDYLADRPLPDLAARWEETQACLRNMPSQ